MMDLTAQTKNLQINTQTAPITSEEYTGDGM